MSSWRLGGTLVALLAALSGCSPEAEQQEEVGTQAQALGSTCARDGDCASGFVCWTSGGSCVRASSCYSGSTGAGVFVGSPTVDATDTAADLQSLGNAWCVTGDVTVKKTSLTDLNGLDGLLTVAGTVSIEDNPALRSLEGLNGLRRTMKVALFRNASLASLAALSKLTTLSSLQVYINPALTDLAGLQNVIGTSWIEVVNNAGLTSLTGLDSITSAYSYIDVRQNPRLTSLAGLGALASVGNLVQVMDNPQLQSLQGLGKLANIGNTLRVMRNPELDDLKGLAKLTSARTFQVSDNAQLDSCNVTALAASAAADCSGCLRNGPCPPADNCRRIRTSSSLGCAAAGSPTRTRMAMVRPTAWTLARGTTRTTPIWTACVRARTGVTASTITWTPTKTASPTVAKSASWTSTATTATRARSTCAARRSA